MPGLECTAAPWRDADAGVSPVAPGPAERSVRDRQPAVTSDHDRTPAVTLELLRAVSRGDIDRLDALVTADDIAASRSASGGPCCTRPCSLPPGDSPDAMVTHLVALGVDVDAQDAWGNTVLFYATRGRRPDLVAALLEAGAPPDPVNDEGVTPLRQTLLVRPVDVASLRLLVAAGADPQHRNGDGASVAELARITVAGDEVLLLLGA